MMAENRQGNFIVQHIQSWLDKKANSPIHIFVLLHMVAFGICPSNLNYLRNFLNEDWKMEGFLSAFIERFTFTS